VDFVNGGGGEVRKSLKVLTVEVKSFLTCFFHISIKTRLKNESRAKQAEKKKIRKVSNLGVKNQRLLGGVHAGATPPPPP